MMVKEKDHGKEEDDEEESEDDDKEMFQELQEINSCVSF